MLKLPTIIWGVALLASWIVWGSVWFLLPGLVLLGLGFFFFKWDFQTGHPLGDANQEDGSALGTPPDNGMHR